MTGMNTDVESQPTDTAPEKDRQNKKNKKRQAGIERQAEKQKDRQDRNDST